MLTAVTLWILALLRRQSLRLSSTDIWRIFGIGAIAALHWVAFYGSIKYANVLGRLILFFRDRFFTALIEPLIFRHGWMGWIIAGHHGQSSHLLYFPGRSSFIETGILIGLPPPCWQPFSGAEPGGSCRRCLPRPVTLYELSGWIPVP